MKRMSRQRDYQRKMRLQSKCIICGKPEHVPCYCKTHYEARMEKIRSKSEAQGTLKSCSVCNEEGHNKRTCASRPRRRKAKVKVTPSASPQPA